MRTLTFVLFVLLTAPSFQSREAKAQRIEAFDLKTEYKSNPVGIDVENPRLAWKLRSTFRDVKQTGYQVRVADSERNVSRGRNLIWDTGKVDSDQSVFVSYEGAALESGKRYFWQVRVWDQDDRRSSWSEPAFFEMGMLTAADWTTHWITADWEEDTSAPQPAHVVRGGFEVDGRITAARAYVTSLGLYELYINGQRVGDQVLTPGWTSYNNQLQYQTYDVTDLLVRGENVMGAMLGDGWYRGYIGFRGQRNFYGEDLALLAQVIVTYRDGSQEVFGTNPNWKATTGPIEMSDIYNGETYDARKEMQGWAATGFDDSGWQGVRSLSHPKDILVAPAGPPIVTVEEIEPIEIITTPEGDTVFDFGQNMVGWVRLAVEGPAGTTVTLRHAEVLDAEGNFYTTNLRAAKQEVKYTLKGGGPEVYEPRFTFQGFRFVAIDGFPGEPTPDALTGVVVHSEMDQTGSFESSHDLVNQLQHNIIWGQKGNFVDVPTDCPQRDERLGWTGDAQVFARTAAFNHDVAAFFTKWLRDLAFDQHDNGAIPHVIPNVLSRDGRGAAGATGWADAGVIIPWTMYEVYGDVSFLENQYESMKQWIGYMKDRAGDDLLWMGDQHFGDWLAFATTRSDYPGATTSKDLLATAFFAYSSNLVAKTADVLGHSEEAQEYRSLSEKIKNAFMREFVTSNGRVGENTQTAYAVALALDILPDTDSWRQDAARRLAEDVRSFGHLTTGFLGTPHLCLVLTEYGYNDEAYQLLLRTDYPSWLYPVTQGATTIWERWDGQRPDGSFQSPGMNSFNHYAYGAIGDWMYRIMAGLDLAEPGYKKISIKPLPGGDFTHAAAEFESVYGTVSSGWQIEDGQMTLKVTVPVNTTAKVRLPNADQGTVTEGGVALTEAEGVSSVSQDNDAVVLEVGSGVYVFTWDWR